MNEEIEAALMCAGHQLQSLRKENDRLSIALNPRQWLICVK